MPVDDKITQLPLNDTPLLTDFDVLVDGVPVTEKVYLGVKLGLLGFVPGGRLTLSSGMPVTIADVSGAASVYYTPYVHDRINLWNGAAWQVVSFTEKTLALGAVTSLLPYDVFGYLSAGTLALEKLAWASASARATGISLQDGRYCKTGDKTKLYLGSFYTISTTQTAESETKRFLFNMYNRRKRNLYITNGTTHTYNVAIARPFNNDQANSDVEFFVGLVEDSVEVLLTGQLFRAAADGAPRISLGYNSATVEYGIIGIAVTAITGRIRGGSNVSLMPVLGYNFICGMEFSTVGTAPGTSFEAVAVSGTIMG